MKKRYILTLLSVLLFFICGLEKLYAYSPNYLPGGKNYLSVDNYSLNLDYFETNSPFLVKPYTDYTLTINPDYAETQGMEVIISAYQNETLLNTEVLIESDFIYFDEAFGEGYYYSFTTNSETNYLSVSFYNTNNYFSLFPFIEFQLEEGNAPTQYEDYIEGSMVDTSAPYFQTSGTVISYFDSPILVSEIQSALVAYDSIDGDVSDNIVLVSDNYSPNINIIGSYEVVFEVSDSSGNSSQVTIDVELVDVLKPIFSDIGIIEAVFPNVYSPEDILNMLSASDNYDGDITNLIVLEDDGYSSNSSIVGEYTMDFSVTDSSGNTQVYTQTIEVVDNDAPIISGVTSIVIGYDQVISTESVSSNLTYNDNYDDQSSLSLILESDNYTGNNTSIGEYSMEFSVTDSSGNKTYQTVNISVVDELGPVIYFNSSIIQTYNDIVMALPDFTQLLALANEIDRNENYYVSIKYDSYTRNAATPGTYHLSLKLTDESGNSLDKNLEIRVVEKDYDYIHNSDVNEIKDEDIFTDKYEIIIGGIATFLLVVSNVVWLGVLKKRS